MDWVATEAVYPFYQIKRISANQYAYRLEKRQKYKFRDHYSISRYFGNGNRTSKHVISRNQIN